MSIFKSGLFSSKVAIVTGGGTGIGKSITQELISLGCKVMISSRKEERLKAAADEIDPTGRSIAFKVCNIREEDQVKDLVSSSISQFGKIDFLVNNGGGQFPQPLADMSLKGWNAVIQTNLTGTYLMSREVYSQWMKDHGGAIVHIIADMFRGFPMMGHTGAARAAVDNLTKTMAVEWAESGVRVNAVAPGTVFSSTASKNYDDSVIGNPFELARPGMPTKRLGTPQEISSAVSFLLSPGASFITGESLKVDGGGSLYSPLFWRIPEHQNLPAYKWTYQPPTNEEDEENIKSKL